MLNLLPHSWSYFACYFFTIFHLSFAPLQSRPQCVGNHLTCMNLCRNDCDNKKEGGNVSLVMFSWHSIYTSSHELNLIFSEGVACYQNVTKMSVYCKKWPQAIVSLFKGTCRQVSSVNRKQKKGQRAHSSLKIKVKRKRTSN